MKREYVNMQIVFLFSSVGLWYVVQRTKLCLDFSCTVHLLHLVSTNTLYGSRHCVHPSERIFQTVFLAKP